MSDQEPLPRTSPHPRPSPGRGALLGVSILAGWFTLDLYSVLGSSEPYLILDLLPSTLLVLAAGAALGALLAPRPKLVWIGVPALLLVSKLPALSDLRLQDTDLWLIRMAILWWLALAGGGALHTRARFGTLRAGLCLGALAGLLQLYGRIFTLLDPEQSALVVPRWALNFHWGFLVGAGVPLALGWLRNPVRRRALTLLAVCVPGFQVGARALAYLEPRRPDLPPPEAVAPPEAPNLLLIVIDTLRADHLASYGYERVTTPGLDALARDHATLYTQARSVSSFTLSSHASLFTGLQMDEHGATHPSPTARPLRPEVTTLAERLRAIGYQTAFVAANGVYLDTVYGIDRGFEYFENGMGAMYGGKRYLALGQLIGARPDVGHLPHRTAERITDLTLEWLAERRPVPFFAAVNYLDVHKPYLPVPPADRAFSADQPWNPLNPEPEFLDLLYDREILYTDAEITRLLDDLEARGLFENTVVIVTSDHGEALGERGFLEHCWTLYENVLHVPLIVKPAGPRRAAIDERRVSSADVHDIALRELGLLAEGVSTSRADPNLIGAWFGEELGRFVPEWAEGLEVPLESNVLAWFEGPRKVIVRSDGSVEAFELDADPRELSPLPLDAEERAAAVERARRWWREHPADPFQEFERDAATLEALRALGYAGG